MGDKELCLRDLLLPPGPLMRSAGHLCPPGDRTPEASPRIPAQALYSAQYPKVRPCADPSLHPAHGAWELPLSANPS